MYLRKIQNQKTEVSIDEPLNVDWDGNELLLSDILGTDGDTVNRELEQEVERSALRGAGKRTGGGRSSVLCGCDLGWTGGEERTPKGGSGYHWDLRNPYISRLEKNHTAAAGGNATDLLNGIGRRAKTPAVSFMRRKGENSRQNIMKCCCNGRG